MADKQKTNKRRVAAARQAERRDAAVAKRDRRRRLVVGAVVGFLALALLAPLTAGLISSNDHDDPVVSTTTLPQPVDLPWVAEQFAGESITGPTPCPDADGAAERTTGFEQAPPLCIADDATFDLTFDTEIGSLTLPVDASLDPDVANLAVVLGRYQAYEHTPLTAVTDAGLIAVGSAGDTGFTIPTTPPTVTDTDLYPIGTVVALVDVDGTASGSLMVVVDEIGSTLLSATPRHVVIGTIDDLSEVEALYETARSGAVPSIDSVEVTETS